jgi:hypothetical protein
MPFFPPAAKHWRSKFLRSVLTIRASIDKRFIVPSTEKSSVSINKRSVRTADWFDFEPDAWVMGQSEVNCC